jgi:hypothetical protein
MRHSLRPRMIAIAPSAAEAVRYAGGWLFDQAMAGWDGAVVTADDGDPRPLDILGVRARNFDALLAAPVLGPRLRAIALRADLYQDDERVRRLVLAAAESGRAEIRLWGDGWAGGFGRSGDLVSHRLSLAARAFKAQALAAADLPGAPGDESEVFRRGELRHPRLVAASLTDA